LITSENEDEILELIKEKVQKAGHLLNNTAIDFKQRLRDAILYVRGDIDKRATSLTDAIEVTRQSLLLDLSHKENEILSQFELDVSKDYKIQVPQSHLTGKMIKEMQEKLEKYLENVQEMFDSFFLVKFRNADFAFDASKFGELSCAVKKYNFISNSEPPSIKAENYRKIRTIKSNGIKEIKMIDNESMAVFKTDGKLEILNTNFDALVQSIKLQTNDKFIFANPTTLVHSDGQKLKIRDLITARIITHETNSNINHLDLLNSGALITAESINLSKKTHIYLRIWRMIQFNLQETCRIDIPGTIEFIRPLQANLVAVYFNDSARFFCAESGLLKHTWSINCLIDIKPLSGSMIIAISLFNIFIYDLESDRVLKRLERYRFCKNDSAYFKSIFSSHCGVFGVFSEKFAYFFDADSFLHLSSIPASVFHENSEVEALIALNYCRFASACDGEIKIFDFNNVQEVSSAKRIKRDRDE